MNYLNYPRHHPQDFVDLEKAIEEFVLPGFTPDRPIIDEASIIRTQGSCFARNLHEALESSEFVSRYFHFPEAINSPIANRIFLDRVVGRKFMPSHKEHDHLFYEALVSSLKELIPDESLFIFTVGVAGCWYDSENKVPLINVDPANLSGASFRWMTVDENRDHLNAIIHNLLQLNPDLHIVLTLSPVPINRAFGEMSAIAADCLSKSTLRVSIAEAINSAPKNVSYWPSFEIVRWLGSHLPPVFGTDDGISRHVSSDMVELIVRLFLRHYAKR